MKFAILLAIAIVTLSSLPLFSRQNDAAAQENVRTRAKTPSSTPIHASSTWHVDGTNKTLRSADTKLK
jgi:hypothetical protein